MNRNGTSYYPCYDANGNITDYVATNGAVAAHYEYSPFGEIVVQSGDQSDAFTHRFSTKPWCEVTGMSEYELRMYSPVLGRWLSRDPIEENGGINLYGFLDNIPTHRVDKDGQMQVYWGPGFPSPDKCGQDIDVAMDLTMKKIEKDFGDWGPVKRCQRCSGGLTPWGWDIIDLRELGLGVPLTPHEFQGTGLLDRSVTFKGKCHHGSAANYAMFGKIMRLCNGEFGLVSDVWSLEASLARVAAWKLTAYGGAQLNAAIAFTSFGYLGVDPGYAAIKNTDGTAIAPSPHPDFNSIFGMAYDMNWSPDLGGDGY